jgi:hypothetical protein
MWFIQQCLGRADRHKLRVDPVSGDWLCEECYRNRDNDRAYGDWSSLRAPPEYVPKQEE